MNAIFSAIAKIFGFLKAERDPQKQIGRLHRKEYAILKQAVQTAHKIFYFEELLENENNQKRRKIYRQRIKTLKIKFYTLLAKE